MDGCKKCTVDIGFFLFFSFFCYSTSSFLLIPHHVSIGLTLEPKRPNSASSFPIAGITVAFKPLCVSGSHGKLFKTWIAGPYTLEGLRTYISKK